MPKNAELVRPPPGCAAPEYGGLVILLDDAVIDRSKTAILRTNRGLRGLVWRGGRLVERQIDAGAISSGVRACGNTPMCVIRVIDVQSKSNHNLPLLVAS